MRYLLMIILLAGCAMSLETQKNLGALVGIGLKYAVPEAATALNAINDVCTASGQREQELMVEALRKVWTSASDANATEVVTAVDRLVKSTDIMKDNPTQENISHWQEVLGAVCVGTK